MTFLYALRYFVVISVVPPVFIAGFVVAVAGAVARLASDPSAAVDALTPVLLLQLFVAASGFRLPAQRGHFDLLLTSGTPRWQIGLAHCLVSVAPGFLCWICVGLMELVASHGTRSTAFAAGTCVAVVGSSLVPWGTAVYSSRVASALGWLLVMTIQPLARVVSPLRLMGMTVAASGPIAVLVALVAAVVPFAAGMFYVLRGPTPLEGSQ
jgi:hypothetical protein